MALTRRRKERSHGSSDNYHETTSKDQMYWNEESRSRCSKSELVRLLAVAEIASARARSMSVSYRSWLVFSVLAGDEYHISFEFISTKSILEIRWC